MKDGIYNNLSIEDYHSNTTHLSASGLKYAKRCMRALKYYELGAFQRDNVPHFDFGNAFECALQGVDEFSKRVAIYDEKDRPEPDRTFGSKRNKEWKESFFADNSGKYIIKQSGHESYETIEIMLEACYADKHIQSLVKGTNYQTSVFWTCPETKLKFKSRPDFCIVDKSVILDVKTTENASPEAFRRDAAKFDYFLQAITQIEGLQQSGLIEKVDFYFYLVVEKSPPYCAQLYSLSKSEWPFLRDDMLLLFSKVKESQNKNKWVGYQDRSDNPFGVIEITPPPYYQIYNV